MVTVDPVTMRNLTIHESRVHATPGREIRDLGDAILLHDPVDPEPFWNRMVAIRWPAEPAAFDRRLTEALVMFAALGRQPHIWPSPVHDSPEDLIGRLVANGFRDTGAGCVMILTDPQPVRWVVASSPPPAVTVERLNGVAGPTAHRAAASILEVLVDAFDVTPDRRPGVLAETVASLARESFTHYLVRLAGQPVAVARRATFDGLSYLSSIGTASWARGRGLGRLVTASAAADAVEAGSQWTHLGVFVDNHDAIDLYRGLGFERVGEPCPDLLLI